MGKSSKTFILLLAVLLTGCQPTTEPKKLRHVFAELRAKQTNNAVASNDKQIKLKKVVAKIKDNVKVVAQTTDKPFKKPTKSDRGYKSINKKIATMGDRKRLFVKKNLKSPEVVAPQPVVAQLKPKTEVRFTKTSKENSTPQSTIAKTKTKSQLQTKPKTLALHNEVMHTVRAGETLSAIARKHNLAVKVLADINNIAYPYTLGVGQTLIIKPSAAHSATDQDKIEWQWPAYGKLLKNYTPGVTKNNGIAISGMQGAPVKAAANGEVVYSGDALRGYGNLIIIKHSKKFLSAYAHNRKNMVKEGERVKAGQQIAEFGQSGTDSVKLHFEIRYQGKPVDPVKVLPAR